MTVIELIAKLWTLPEDLPVKVYELDGDFWDNVAGAYVVGTEVRITGKYGELVE